MLNAYNRAFDPFSLEYFVMCEKLEADGFELKFGDKYPEYCQVNFKELHFNHGVVGTKEEFESLNGEPVKLYHTDPLMPIALFVQDPEGNFEKLKEKAKDSKKDDTFIPDDAYTEEEKKEEELEPFNIENAKLIHHRKDIKAYAQQYGIRLKASDPKDKMLETLEERAKKKGLL